MTHPSISSPPTGRPTTAPATDYCAEDFDRAVGTLALWPHTFRMGAHDTRVVAVLLAGVAALVARSRPNPHNGSCAACFFAGEHIDALHELISNAAPEGWAAAGDVAAANEWAKQAVELMRQWESRRGPTPREDGEPEPNHPGKIAELVPKFVESVWYYLRELLDGDQPWHVIGHVQQLCLEFDVAVRAELTRLRGEPTDLDEEAWAKWCDSNPPATGDVYQREKRAFLAGRASKAVK